MDSIEAAMATNFEKMATCEFYAHIYDDGLRVRLATSTTTKAFDDGLEGALKNLYAAVQAFLDKAKQYFDPRNSGTLFEQFLAAIAFPCLIVCIYSNENCESL